jgi:hypothetical protein
MGIIHILVFEALFFSPWGHAKTINLKTANNFHILESINEVELKTEMTNSTGRGTSPTGFVPVPPPDPM